MSLRLPLLAALLALAALVLAGSAAAHRDTAPKVVASGLDNPRDLDVDASGTVYVTEAGRGGSGPCITGEMGTTCAGATGAVTRIRDGEQHRVLEGLPSLAPTTGEQALGPSDISLRRFGGAYLTVGLGANPAVRAELGELGPAFDQLYKTRDFDHLRAVADIGAFEAAANPDGGEIDSNANSVTRAGHRLYVVDAGGNDLLRVRRSGEISTVAVFPDRLLDAPPGMGLPPQVPVQAVPTNVVVGPDGALYVSQLTGFPFIPGAARVYRVVPGSAPEIFADGLTNVTDLAFDRHGNLYVVEIAANGLLSGDPTGALIKIRPDGSRETVLSEGLVNPYGIAIGPHGAIYISNHGASPGVGEVLRLAGHHH
jgi:sugar lactone lactonase YvrE